MSEEYIVVSLDFQMLGTEDFADEARFSSAFLDVFIRECELGSIDGADELLKPLRELARGNGYGLKGDVYDSQRRLRKQQKADCTDD